MRGGRGLGEGREEEGRRIHGAHDFRGHQASISIM